MIDRRDFEAWSAKLDDERFVAALAALGVLAAIEHGALDDDTGAAQLLAERVDAVDAAVGSAIVPALFALLKAPVSGRYVAPGVLAWRTPPVPDAGGSAPTGLRQWPDAGSLADAWEAYSCSEAPLRLAVQDDTADGRATEFAGLLSRNPASIHGVHAIASWAPEPTAWHWPITIATLPTDLLGVRLAEEFPAGGPARIVPVRVDIPALEVLALGVPLPDALARTRDIALPARCALVVIAGFGDDSAIASASQLRDLAARARAGGVIVAPAMDVERLAGALRQLVEEMGYGCPLDIALMRALGAGHVAWLHPKMIALGERPPPRQSAARSARSAFPREEAAPPEAVAPAAAPPAPATPRAPAPPQTVGAAGAPVPDEERTPARHLQQRSLRRSGESLERIRDAYVLDEEVTLRVRIGAPDDPDWDSAPAPFPEHELPKDRDEHTLQVVVHEPDHFDEPMLRDLVLPRTGPSRDAEFVFTPRSIGAFDARISVLHRGRVLQTARLRTRVLASRSERAADDGAIALLDEAQVRHDWSDLGRRRRFDLAIVLNHTADDRPRLTAVAEQRAWATNLDGIRDPLLQLNAALSSAAHSIADHSDGLDQGENPQLLVRLARIGADLYSALCLDQFVELTEGGFDPRADTLTHVQVVSARADAVVPIEFFYDYPPPASDAKQVCPGYRDALRTGRCPPDCTGRADPAAYVCPMGFWGLRKVIERHIYSPRLGRPDDAELVIQAEPAAGRDRIDLGRCAVLGFSKEVPKTSIAPLLELLSPRFADATLEAADWNAWKSAIELHKPTLLVAFPHNERKQQDIRLEIGGDFLSTLRLPSAYVRAQGAPPPLVFLLGCDVAGTAESFSNHIRYFRQAGAAVVITTIATVFGEHAVEVGAKILARLLRAGGDDADQLGELILDARREAMLDSLPMAMCVVAFGDADWRL